MTQFSDKFIGFVDILGFTNMVTAAEQETGMPLDRLLRITAKLGTDEHRKAHEKYGPAICPESPKLRKDLDFQITQISDCVLVSAEISPAGVINLVSHCWGACMNLLGDGIMCRGYIKRGRIFHEGHRFAGSGYTDAMNREKSVSIFKRDADEQGTPFVEVDPEVVRYITENGDNCVKEMFGRMVHTEGELTALFPFKILSGSFVIGGLRSSSKLDVNKEKRALNELRVRIQTLQERVTSLISPENSSAVRKGQHYVRMLEKELATCDRTEELIDLMTKPFPALRYNRKDFPGLS